MDDLNDIIDAAVGLDDEALIASAQGEEHTFSDSYNLKMAVLTKGVCRTRKPASLRKRIVAIVLVAALLTSSVTAGAFWKEISVFFQSLYSQYADLRVVQKPGPVAPMQDDVMSSWKSYWYLDYLPEGYSFSQATNRPSVKSISFQSEHGDYLDFEQVPSGLVIGNDTEGTPVEGVSVGDFETFAFEKEVGASYSRILLWSNDSVSFSLTGQLSFDELKSIAKNIVYIENEGE